MKEWVVLKPKYLLPLPLILLLLWYFTYPSTQPKPSIQLNFSPVFRVLHSTRHGGAVIRLPYRNHKAVLLARKALRAGLSYDASQVCAGAELHGMEQVPYREFIETKNSSTSFLWL